MIRRKFIQLITLAGTGSLATIGVTEAVEKKTVTYRVTGFTCVTCAVGLEVMLRRENGVTWAKASYPKANVLIKFNPREVTEDSLRSYIASMGFKTEEVPKA
ncbi:MAG: heavy-metal-associated domain-containing protein [Edaphobacter sp.]